MGVNVLPKEAVIEFQEIYQRKIGETLTINDASVKAENFLRLMMLLTGKARGESKDISFSRK